MANVVLPTVNKNWWEPAVNQASNFLWQMGMANYAKQLRMQEAAANRAYEQQEKERQMDQQLAMSGYQQLPEGAAVEPGVINVGGKMYKPPAPVPVKYGDQFLGYIYRDAKGSTFIENPKQKAADKLPTSIQEYLYSKEDPEFGKFLDRKQATGKQGENFQIEMDPATGAIRVFKGDGQPTGMPLSTGSKTEVEKKIVDIDTSLGRVKDIINQYKPEFQQLGSRWQNIVNSVKEKMGMPISEIDKQSLSDFSSYRKTSVAAMNEEIKRLTGAQMSAQEAQRLMRGMPNPGTGLFDGDSPTEFEAALKSTYKNLAKTKARLMYYRAKGLGDDQIKKDINTGKVVSLDDMDKIINNRAAQIERELATRNPNMDQKTVTQTVRQILKSEFGIE